MTYECCMIGILQELRYRRINIALLRLEHKRDAVPRWFPLLAFWTYLCLHLCNSFNRFSFLFFFSSFALTARSNAFCPYFCPDSARFGASEDYAGFRDTAYSNFDAGASGAKISKTHLLSNSFTLLSHGPLHTQTFFSA